MKKYPIYMQDDPTTCGVYCIKMILKYYGFDEDIQVIKKKTRVNQNGTTIKGLVETLKSYNVESIGYECPIELLDTSQGPLILHYIMKDQGHFVVLYRKHHEKYVIGDPASGLKEYSQEEVEKYYSGYMISIRHVGRYYHYHNPTLRKHLFELFKTYKKDMMRYLSLSLLMTILTYMITFMYSYLIDSLKVNTPMFISCLFILSYLLVQIVKSLVVSLKKKESIYLKRLFDRHYVYDSMIQYHKGLLFEDKEAGILQSKYIHLYELSDYTTQLFETITVEGVMSVLLLIGLVLIHPLLPLFSLVLFLLFFLFMKYSSKRLVELYRKEIKSQQRNENSVLEYFHLFDIGKRYYDEKWLKRYEYIYEDTLTQRENLTHYMRKLTRRIDIMTQVISSFVLLFGLYSYHKGVIPLGFVFSSYMLVSMLYQPMISLSSLLISYHQNTLLYEYYKEFHSNCPEHKESLDETMTSITINNLSYSYGYGENVIHHFNMSIDHSLFLLGPSGCGKSTLLKLLLGMDDHYTGELLINRKEVKDYCQQSLLDHIGYMSDHEAFIYDSIHYNLFDTSLEILEELSKIVLLDLIPLLHLTIHEDGTPLSLGQRKKLALARLLLEEKDIYLLDEVMHGIDDEEARQIIQSMKDYRPNALFIIVTHNRNIIDNPNDCVIMKTT